MAKYNRFFSPVLSGTLLLLLVIGHHNYALAQIAIPDSSKKSSRLFEDDNLIEITLRFDLSSYFKTKLRKNYLTANLTLNSGKTDSINKDIRLRTRGVFRNQYCFYPPIELNLNKVQFGYTDLNRISKIKLVTPCMWNKENEDYVLKEYLAYKLFSVLTDTSFRVRLLKVNYIDTKNKRKPTTQYGFFIEPVNMLTARTNSIQIKSRTLNQKSIVPYVMDRLAIFNYMIGNYDWAVPVQHNVLIIKPLVYEVLGRGIAIPYDFDWTGLVNADYAVPAENVGTQNVRERIFLGVCRSEETYKKDLQMFLKKKEEFYKVINEFPYLSQGAKKDMINYLNGFFDNLEGRRDFILETLMNSCKNF
jgi:hypothetical protein